MWPYICQFVEKLFRDTIEPAVQGAHAQLSTFTFSKIDMGDKVQAHVDTVIITFQWFNSLNAENDVFYPISLFYVLIKYFFLLFIKALEL